MASLTVNGDPDGWLDTGRSVSTLMAQLESELLDADSTGGSGLSRSWRGPAATAYAADWASRRSRFEDLIYNARRVAQAVAEYGQQLASIRTQAAQLESRWCSLGLHVAESGLNFMLPPGIDLLPSVSQVSLKQALSESVTDVERLGSAIVDAAEDLAVALTAAVAELEDFDLIEVGTLAGGAVYLANHLKGPLDDIGHVVDLAKHNAKYIMDDSKRYASELGHDLHVGTPEQRSAASPRLGPAGQDAHDAESFYGDVDELGKGVLIAQTVVLGVQIVAGVPRHGLVGSLESHAGESAQLGVEWVESTSAGAAIAAGAVDLLPDAVVVAVTAAAPEEVLVVGAVVIAGAVAWGVGKTVQEVVDHRKAIGHFVESIF